MIFLFYLTINIQVSWEKGFKKNILARLTVNLIKHKMITSEGNSKYKAVLPGLIRKLGQVGLNFSECYVYQKQDATDMVQTKFNPNEYPREKYCNLHKLFLKISTVWEFDFL